MPTRVFLYTFLICQLSISSLVSLQKMEGTFLSFPSLGLQTTLKLEKRVTCLNLTMRLFYSHLKMTLVSEENRFLTQFFSLMMNDVTDASKFHKSLAKLQHSGKDLSVFTERTEDSSASQYFQFYGYLSQQQNMMQDYIRTSTYQRAILSNVDDFRVSVKFCPC